MNLLETIQSAMRRSGLPAPSVAVLSTDANVQRMVELMHEEGRELASRYPWQKLINETALVSDGTGDFGVLDTIAPGFDYIVNNTIWNLTTRRQVPGPVDASTWAQMIAQRMLGPWPNYRIYGNHLLTYPWCPSGQTIKFEYVSKYWIVDSTGVSGKEFATDDTDTFLIDPWTVALGCVWRWKQSTGMEYAEDFQKYERRVADLMSRDGSKAILNMTGGRTDLYPGVLVPSGNWMV